MAHGDSSAPRRGRSRTCGSIPWRSTRASFKPFNYSNHGEDLFGFGKIEYSPGDAGSAVPRGERVHHHLSDPVRLIHRHHRRPSERQEQFPELRVAPPHRLAASGTGSNPAAKCSPDSSTGRGRSSTHRARTTILHSCSSPIRRRTTFTRIAISRATASRRAMPGAPVTCSRSRSVRSSRRRPATNRSPRWILSGTPGRRRMPISTAAMWMATRRR